MATAREHAQRSPLFLCLALAFTVVVDNSSHAYMFMHVGVDSNFLADQARVFFVQADGSLTVLRLETGEVVTRKKGSFFRATLRRVKSGILLSTHERIALLNPDTLEQVWETRLSYAPNVVDNRLVSYDGNGLIECRDMQNGSALWSYNLPGALEIVAQDEKVLIHRAATYGGLPTTVLLDLITGKELFRKEPPANIHYGSVFFDGTNIYLTTGSFTNKRSDAKLDKLTVWNVSGADVEVLPVPPEPRDGFGYRTSIALDGKIFAQGRVWPSETRDGEPESRIGGGRAPSETAITGGGERIGWEFPLSDGTLKILATESQGQRDIELQPVRIRLNTAGARWQGALEYLRDGGAVTVVGEAGGKILLGTNLGHVECVDKVSGKSQWVYVFPTLRHTMSYSSHGMPPTMATAARIYRRENERRPPPTGLQVDGAAPNIPTVVYDPSPANPFKNLPLYLAYVWSGAIIPSLFLIWSCVSVRSLRYDVRIFGFFSACVLVGLTLLFFEFGRVSVSSSIALRLSMIVAFGAGFVFTRQLYVRRNWASAILLGLVLTAGAVLLFPIFLHF